MHFHLKKNILGYLEREKLCSICSSGKWCLGGISVSDIEEAGLLGPLLAYEYWEQGDTFTCPHHGRGQG